MEASAEGVSVRNGQDRRVLPAGLLDQLADCGARALRHLRQDDLCRTTPPDSVEVVLIDDAEIARVHGEFMDDPTPTDVITFPYGAAGEVLVSVETAARQAAEFGQEFTRELALYLVHGLLHLCGYEDATDEGGRRMVELQEALVARCYEGP